LYGLKIKQLFFCLFFSKNNVNSKLGQVKVSTQNYRSSQSTTPSLNIGRLVTFNLLDGRARWNAITKIIHNIIIINHCFGKLCRSLTLYEIVATDTFKHAHDDCPNLPQYKLILDVAYSISDAFAIWNLLYCSSEIASSLTLNVNYETCNTNIQLQFVSEPNLLESFLVWSNWIIILQ